MIIKPELNSLLDKVDCRYTLVVETAKRARQLVDSDIKLRQDEATGENEFIENPVHCAVEEIADGDITYIRPEEDSQNDGQ